MKNRTRILKSLLVSVLTACAFVSAQATIHSYTVSLSGPNEFPVNASPGTGFGTVNYDDVNHLLQLQVSYSGLQGTVSATHIHATTTAPFFQNAGVAVGNPSLLGFITGATSGTYSNTLDLTQASVYGAAFLTANGNNPAQAEATVAAAMASSSAYWNIHTSAFPGGEIRGFTVAVPEPSSLALAGLGIAAIAARVWSKRREKIS